MVFSAGALALLIIILASRHEFWQQGYQKLASPFGVPEATYIREYHQSEGSPREALVLDQLLAMVVEDLDQRERRWRER